MRVDNGDVTPFGKRLRPRQRDDQVIEAVGWAAPWQIDGHMTLYLIDADGNATRVVMGVEKVRALAERVIEKLDQK